MPGTESDPKQIETEKSARTLAYSRLRKAGTWMWDDLCLAFLGFCLGGWSCSNFPASTVVVGVASESNLALLSKVTG